MAGNWKSIMGGAAVAALLILPAFAGDGDWSQGPWRSFDSKSVQVKTLVGKLRVEGKRQAEIPIQVSGTKARVNDVTVRTEGDRLVVSSESDESVWDWKNWFNFND